MMVSLHSPSCDWKLGANWLWSKGQLYYSFMIGKRFVIMASINTLYIPVNDYVCLPAVTLTNLLLNTLVPVSAMSAQRATQYANSTRILRLSTVPCTSFGRAFNNRRVLTLKYFHFHFRLEAVLHNVLCIRLSAHLIKVNQSSSLQTTSRAEPSTVSRLELLVVICVFTWK